MAKPSTLVQREGETQAWFVLQAVSGVAAIAVEAEFTEPFDD